MTLLITLFLVLVNIFNTITANIPKAEGLTAIETYVVTCIVFVFGALLGKNISGFSFILFSIVLFRICCNTAFYEDEEDS